eukprot:9129435-Alexandrium_andersonii.AAC.1
MAAILALTKGRSSSPAMLSICRQWAAAVLALQLQPVVRWVPSERNAADSASRGAAGGVLTQMPPRTRSASPPAPGSSSRPSA